MRVARTLVMQSDTPWVEPDGDLTIRRHYFPAFDLDEVSRCIEYLVDDYPEPARALDQSSLLTQQSGNNLMGFMLLRAVPVSTFGFAAFSAFIFWSTVQDISRSLNQIGGSWISLTLLLFMFVSMTLCGSFMAVHRWPDLQFQRAVARVQKLTQESGAPMYRVVRCANLAGRAARELFQVHQGRRFTWVSPPTVADRALSLSFPLINVELGHEADPGGLREVIHVYGEFLHFAAALEAAKRSELIPRLRDYYAKAGLLNYRNSEPHDELSERDALFLDPMRNHSRWAVAKDFLYPLSSWLSLAVAVVALVVSLTK